MKKNNVIPFPLIRTRPPETMEGLSNRSRIIQRQLELERALQDITRAQAISLARRILKGDDR